MQSTLKMVLVVILVIYLFIISKSVKHKNMRINYLIFWSIAGILLIIALLAPNFIENITRLITKEQNKNVMLIQEISMLKQRIEKIEKEGNKNEGI